MINITEIFFLYILEIKLVINLVCNEIIAFFQRDIDTKKAETMQTSTSLFINVRQLEKNWSYELNRLLMEEQLVPFLVKSFIGMMIKTCKKVMINKILIICQ